MRLITIAIAVLLAWRVVSTGLADHFAQSEPGHALTWQPHHPQALLNQALARLAKGKSDQAATSALEVLRFEPLAGDAFVILAKAAEDTGDEAALTKLYRLAARRAPHNAYGQSLLVESLLHDGKLADAVAQFDILYRVSPPEGSKYLPAFAQLCSSEPFADALAAGMADNPLWKSSMLVMLLDHGDHDAIEHVFSDLKRSGNLADKDTALWLDRLMQEGLWGEAYSRWVSSLKLTRRTTIPLLYNGNFANEPTGEGFDWRIRPTAGVVVERTQTDEGTGDYAINVTFTGRRVPEINIEQRLLLAPGSYTLRFRARADSLHSDKGLQWAIDCLDDRNDVIARGALLEGTFDWKPFDTAFDVPASCAAQRLWLRNAGADAAGKEVTGNVWFSNFAISTKAQSGAE